MGSSFTPPSQTPPTPPPSPAFCAAFAHAAGAGGVLRFDAFMALALYDPGVGYYRRDRLRVGRKAGGDFYTATSLGQIFGQLVAAASTTLLHAAGLDPAATTFVELGAEPGGGVLSVLDPANPPPFARACTLRLGDQLVLPRSETGPCVVFSNELFDAQPVRRFTRRAEAWHELGVALRDGTLHEHDLGPVSLDNDAQQFLPPLETTPEGYKFDAPRAAAELAAQLARQPWHGLFIAFDYGKTFPALAAETPQGTARAYFQHTQHNDLLTRPGEQDLTAHVCWDWLTEALRTHGAPAPRVESQEAFFVHHAGPWIAAALAHETSASSPRKRALMHLLHPAQMGQKFQVLHAVKPMA